MIAVWIIVGWVGGVLTLAALWSAYRLIGRALVARGRRCDLRLVHDEPPEDWMSQVVVFDDPLQDNPAAWPEFVPETEETWVN